MSDTDLKKIILGFRVSDLVVLLAFAGRNKCGKKTELQKRALELIKLRSPAVELKIRELQKLRYQQQSKGLCDPQDMSYPLGNMNQPMTSGYGSSVGHHAPLGHGSMVNTYQPPHCKPNISSHQPSSIMPQYAVNPDVKFKDLPFFDVLGELLRPSTLIPLHGERFQESQFIFHLTPQQAHQLSSDEEVRVQLRFCLLETSCDQEDNFPSSICVKVNKRLTPLPNPIPTNKPGVDPKRPSRPVDITQLCRLTPTLSNEIHISWASTYGRAYVVAVFLVRKLNFAILLHRLKANGVRNPDHTTAMIKEKLCQDRDSEIATMSLRGSLICPLGKIKMMLPCRALTCTHLQCFDATLYIQMNEKKPKWICPVCDKPALFKDLAIDGLFLDIATKAPEVCTEVQFHDNGSWTPVMPTKKVEEINDSQLGVTPAKEVPKPKKPPAIEVVNLDSDSDTEDSWPIAECISVPPPAKKLCKPTPTPVPIMTTSVADPPLTKNSNNFIPEAPTTPVDSRSKLYEPSTSGSLGPVSSTPSNRETVNIGSLQITSFTHEGIFPNSPKLSDGHVSPSICAPITGSYSDPISGSDGVSGMSNFDLYSLIQQNQNDYKSFLPIPEIETPKPRSPPRRDQSPDIISID